MNGSIVVPEEVLLSAVQHELPRVTARGLVLARTIAGIAESLSAETAKKLEAWIWDELQYKSEKAHYTAWTAAHDALRDHLLTVGLPAQKEAI